VEEVHRHHHPQSSFFQIDKREIVMADTVPSGPPPIAFKKRGAKANLRKRPATPPPASSDESSEYSSEDEGGRRVKRPRKSAVVTASTAANKTSHADHSATKFAADRSTTLEQTNDATRQSNWYEEKELSAKNLLGKTRAKPTEAAEEAKAPDGTYKGTSKYSNFISKNPNAPARQVGPIKTSTNVRTITIIDFSPDVCKDYKQTGFCGFGDNCKFLHAREDYKQGWALDKEWEINTKGKKQSGTVIGSANKPLDLEEGENEEDVKLLETIPFACVICKKSYTNPVVTRCGHYFCEGCALQRYRKKPDCAVCGGGTNGVFNGAKGLAKILERKRKREERLQDKADAEKEEGAD